MADFQSSDGYSFFNNWINLNVHYDVSIDSHIDKDQSNEVFPNLKNGWLLFLKKNKYGILTTNSFSIAMACRYQIDREISNTFSCMIHMLEGQSVTEQHPKVYRAICILRVLKNYIQFYICLLYTSRCV